MRKFVIAAALAASALTAAAPAAAQYYPQPQGYGYGYGNNWGQVRRLQVRIDQLQRQIRHLDRRNILSEREAVRLRNDSREIEQRLRFAARNGLHPQEAYQIDRRIQRLEIRIHREARDGNRYGGYGYNQYGQDRDRDGLNDRYERDRGTNYDEDREPDSAVGPVARVRRVGGAASRGAAPFLWATAGRCSAVPRTACASAFRLIGVVAIGSCKAVQ